MKINFLRFLMLCAAGLAFASPVCAAADIAVEAQGIFAHDYIVGVVCGLAVLCLALAMAAVLTAVKLGKMKKAIAESKLTDEETGIGNMTFFKKSFDNIVSDALSRYCIAYVLIDSNYLSIYHGEAVFATMVKYVAETLKSFEEEGEFSARIAENGFAFAFKGADNAAAEARAAQIVEKLDMFITFKDKNIQPYYHAAVYSLNESDSNCALLLHNLRKNCYFCEVGARRLVICDAQAINSAAEEKRLFEKIEQGFQNREFKLYLQFIVDNKTKKIISAEALSRWEPSDGEVLPPIKYINVMKQTGLIVKLDYYMFEMVCERLQKWSGTEFDALTVSCNFTRITISKEDFIDNIKKIADKYTFEHKKLLIEITEDAIENNIDMAMDNILRAKQLGFTIALDDMGSGYTSLMNLCEYTIDVVKIDREILLRTDKSNGKDLFIGIISLAHNLNLEVVCEGVETEEQNALVSGTDCDYIQGWYYSRVLPECAAEDFVKKYTQKMLSNG